MRSCTLSCPFRVFKCCKYPRGTVFTVEEDDTCLTLLHAGVKSVKWRVPLVCCQSVVLQQVCSLQTQHYESGIEFKTKQQTTDFWAVTAAAILSTSWCA